MKHMLLSLLLCMPCLAIKPPPGFEQEQLRRWAKAVTKPECVRETRMIVDSIAANRWRFAEVEKVTGCPWWVPAILNEMETGGSFRYHLHNGDPLSWWTVQVPRHRPQPGKPPFTWQYSAQDAIRYDHMQEKEWAVMAKALVAFEAWNGLGVAVYHPEAPSVYMVGGTNLQRPGKYVADGKWSSTAISHQIGVIPILREMIGRGLIDAPSS